jgi:putative transposase
MSHTYTQNTVHVVFSTKDRCKLIPKEFKSRLCSYLAGICKQDGIFVHAIDGMEDHVHLLIQIPATLALAKAVNTLKSNSSKWANDDPPRRTPRILKPSRRAEFSRH